MFWFLILLVLLNYTGASDNPDDFIERPCPRNTLKCIRKYFVTHSHCKIHRNTLPDVLIRPDNFVTSFGLANVTAQFENLAYSGMKPYVLDFYVNPSTDRVVLVIGIPSLNLSTDTVTAYFHRRGLEPLSNADAASSTFTDIILTATIPNINNLQMKEAFITAYTYNGYPAITLGSKFLNDDITRPYLDKFLARGPDAIQHMLQRIAPFALHTYVKYSICDFRLPLRVYLE